MKTRLNIILFLVFTLFMFISGIIPFTILTECYAQTLKKTAQLQITQKTLIKENPAIRKINGISSHGLILTSESFGGNKEYSLKNPKSLSKAVNNQSIFSKQVKSKESVYFALNDRFLIIRKKEVGDGIIEIYDTINGVSKTLKSDAGRVPFAAVADLDNIIYEVKPQNGRTKVYLSSKNTPEPLFIAESLAPKWSPNGKYFLVDQYQSSEMLYREKLDYGIITSEKFKEDYDNGLLPDNFATEKIPWVLVLYDRKGNKKLELDQLKNTSNWIRWAPDSNKLVLRERGKRGFYIVYFSNTEENITIENIYYFEGFENRKNEYNYCSNPQWSPDGSKIAFTKLTEDGHRILGRSIWVLEDHTYAHHQIADLSNSSIINLKWTFNNTLIVLKENSFDNTMEVVEFNLE